MSTSENDQATTEAYSEASAASASKGNGGEMIWSMRVQQELLALTSDSTSTGSSSSSTPSTNTPTTASPSPNSIMLPPFITIQDHALDIAAGTCVVTVTIDLLPKPKQSVDSGSGGGTIAAIPETNTNNATTQYDTVTVAMDVSMVMGASGTSASSKSSSKTTFYPFVPPTARLVQGAQHFASGSTIENSQNIAMNDIDWTPSLHLTDAILHVALKVRECIAQNEPMHAAPAAVTSSSDKESYEDDPIDKVVGEVVDEVKKGARRLASTLGSFGKKAFSPKPNDGSKAATNASKTKGYVANSRSKSTTAATTTTKTVVSQNVKIGDEVNLLEEPWVSAHGVYSCKAIRRPPFIEQVIAAAAASAKSTHATSGSSSNRREDQPHFASPTNMFRSLAQSARSVMEESFLMITDTHIIELRASKLNMQMGTVTFCIPIEFMSKLKFRRQESLSLFFKTSPDDPLVYMCPDSGDAVHQIQSVLKQKGVRGKHTNATAYRAINEALEMVKLIQAKESALEQQNGGESSVGASSDISLVESVNEIMDLYRQAAEKFESAGDIRHEEVVTHMRKFLAKASTIGILESSKPEQAVESTSVSSPAVNSSPASVVSTPAAIAATTPSSVDVSTPVSTPTANDVKTEILDKYDLTDYDDDDDYDEFGNPKGDSGGPSLTTDFSTDDIDDMAADLDAMMREADKELAELMKS